MLVILSQKVDSESSYADELFNSYHYPARYKNQLHEGDTVSYTHLDVYKRQILQKPLTIRQTSRMTNVNCWAKQMEKMWKSSPKSLAMVQ